MPSTRGSDEGIMKNQRKIAPWRIVVFICAVAFILFLWIKKDVSEIYATMPTEQIAPLIVTTVAVSLLKVAAIAGGILLVRWIVGRIMKNK